MKMRKLRAKEVYLLSEGQIINERAGAKMSFISLSGFA